MRLQEVSRAHSTRKGKGQTQSVKKLNPQYVVGFVDGEGSFSISVYAEATMRNKVFVRPEFEIELRADDKPILQRIQRTLGCGIVYDCNYERYGWYPHAKYKVARLDDITNIVIPFFEKHQLQGKKREVFKIFKAIMRIRMRDKHLSKSGVEQIIALRKKMRLLGKKRKSMVGNR